MADQVAVILNDPAIQDMIKSMAEEGVKTFGPGMVKSTVRWIRDKLHNHSPKAIEKASQRALDFELRFARRVHGMILDGTVSKEAIETALDDPAFSMRLQQAVLASSETDDEEKHELLARLLGQRLAVESETTIALASRMAVDAISQMTRRQLRVLGFLNVIHHIRPENVKEAQSNDEYYEILASFLQSHLAPYMGLEYHGIDVLHLEALSCVQYNRILTYDLAGALKISRMPNLRIDAGKFGETNVGRKSIKLWNDGMANLLLTSVGQIVGTSVSDLLVGATTTYGDWDND